MAEFSPEDASRAENIVSQLFEREGYVEGQNLGDLVLSDVEWSVRQFTNDLRVLEAIQSDVPTLEFAEQKVPVSLSYALTAGLAPWSPQLFQIILGIHGPGFLNLQDYLHYRVNRLRNRRGPLELAWMNRKEARYTFRRRTIDFLATRIAGLRWFSEQNPILIPQLLWPRRLSKQTPLQLLQFLVPRWFSGKIPEFLRLPRLLWGEPELTPGCNFTVTTKTRDLRVFWSGANYAVPTYFGYPTYPVSNVLQSGNYVFGVDGGIYGDQIQWDKNAAISLPGPITEVHLNK